MQDRTRRRVQCTALMMAVSVGASIVGAAAQGRGATQRKDTSELSRPGWLTIRVADGIQATPAERAILTARWAEYDRLFITRQSLVKPQGFTVGPAATGSLSSGVVHLNYSYIFFKGVMTTRGEGTALLTVVENPSAGDVAVVDQGSTFSDSQGEIYTERPRHRPPPGIPANAFVFDELQIGSSNPPVENRIRVVLTSDGQLPWSDVSRERVLNILIAKAQEDLKRVEKAASAPSFLTNDAELRERWATAIATAKGRVTRLTGELAAMSAAERAMPAWIQVASAGTITFGSPNASGFEHLIADNPDYYRLKGSRTQLRAMLIMFGLTHGSYAEMNRAVADSYNAFDWAAAARLLGAPTK